MSTVVLKIRHQHNPGDSEVRLKLLCLVCFISLLQLLAGCSAAAPEQGATAVARSVTGNTRNRYQFEAGRRLGEARLFSPWWKAMQRNAAQQVEFDDCVVNVNSCSRKWRALRQVVLQGRSLSIEDRLQLVNRYLNRRDYKDDRRRNNAEDPVPGVRSHWSTLYEFLKRGGDCEDYAASKYFLLRMLDFEPAQMRVVVAWESKLRGFHAVLAYRWADGRVWLLESDNVIKKRSHTGYRYVYALNELGVWDYRSQP